MGLWDRLTAKFRSRSGASGEVSIVDERLVFHSRARAAQVPNEPDQWGPAEMSVCGKCGAPVRRIVFTTAGEGEQTAVWREYPLAVDGWICGACGWSAVPRRMPPDEVTECIQTGLLHARKGGLDDAEYWLRRAACSWPDYAPGLVHLAEVALSREGDKARPAAERARLRGVARTYLQRAVEKDPTNVAETSMLQLARLEALAGQEAEALARLEELGRREGLRDDVKAELEGLLLQIQEGRALFSRASELASDLLVIEGRPATTLASAEKERLLEASGLLASAAARNPKAFGTWWMLGKVRQRLGDHRAALEAMGRAVECNPSQVDGCREYVFACLEVGDGPEAVRMARRACELRPEDAGLRSNLAVAQLIAGQLEEASATVAAALQADPADKITRALAERIASVRTGRRPVPRTLAELEGRR